MHEKHVLKRGLKFENPPSKSGAKKLINNNGLSLPVHSLQLHEETPIELCPELLSFLPVENCVVLSQGIKSFGLF
jgi:hypothetical protein